MENSAGVSLLSVFKDVFAFYGILSPEGFLLNLQGNFFEKTDIEPEVFIGQRFSETVFWQSAEHIAETLQKALDEARQGRKEQLQLDFRLNAKNIKTVELHLNPVKDETGKIREIIFCAQDVTAYRQEINFYKERAEHFLFAAESAEIGLWFWDLTSDEFYSTPTCNRLFETAPNESFTFNNLVTVLHPEDRASVVKKIKKSQQDGKDYTAEFRVVHSDNSVNWISARGRTCFDSEHNPVNMMGIVRQITDTKIQNEKLSEIYEKEKKARDEAEEANRAKDFFLAFVSHELRSPLNAILGWTKILLTKEVDDKTRVNALETIERSARAQAKLIEDLVDSARVASGKLRLEMRPINLFDILNAVFNSQKPSAENQNIKLEFEFDSKNAEVFGDSTRLQQVFTNLVTNALKFTPKGGRILVKMKTYNDKVTILIKDTGQGIAPETLPSIFRQFSQGDEKTSRDTSGLGLGLSIVRTLVEKHGGQVTAHSEGLGRGSTFSVMLPLFSNGENPAEGETETEEEDNNQVLRGTKILVVEDDPDSRAVLQLFLEQSGAKVESAESADEAINILKTSNNHLFDVIVSDLAMPEEDGFSLLQRIRQLPSENGGAIPAVALSAFAAAEDKERARKVGFQKYHTKPFEPDLLVDEILELIGK